MMWALWTKILNEAQSPFRLALPRRPKPPRTLMGVSEKYFAALLGPLMPLSFLKYLTVTLQLREMNEM